MSELDEFTYVKVIGKGSYGEVWLVRHNRDRKQYVLKKMNLSKASKRERTSADQEVKLLSRLKHPNIVSYRNSFETEDGNLHIAMQYCEGGDLYQRLKEQKGVLLEERQVVEWFVQIAMALQYMHERNILHRDLKTQNIFLTKSKIIKVGDLGIARVLDSACDMATTLIGTPYYMSPELFSNKPYNHKSDIWALGCCVYEMATLRHAFNARDMNALVYKILKGRMPAMPRQYSPELVNLIKSMLLLDPEKRPSVSRILRDQFIKKNIAIFLEDTRRNSRRPAASRNRPGSADLVSASSAHSRPGSADSVSVSSARSRPGSSDSVSTNSAQSQPSPVEPVPSRRLPPVDIPEECASKLSSDDGIRAPVAKTDVSTSLEPTPVKSRIAGDGESKQPPADTSDRVRKKSDIARYDLEPISEKAEKRSPESTANTEDTEEDTIVPTEVEEVKPVVKAPSKKKHSFLKARANSDSNIEPPPPDEEETEPKGKKSVFKENAKVQRRPLPPPLVSVSGEGLPVSRKDILVQEEQSSGYSSKSSSISSSKEEYLLGDVPRSLPNLSARERRRQKQDVSNSQERPNSARPRLKRMPDRHDSQKVTKAEKSQQGPQRSGLSKKHRQPSIKDDESSSNSSQEEANEVQKDHRKAKEMNNFISLLDTTLKMNPAEEKSDEERGSPDGSTDLLSVPENNTAGRRHSVPCISPETLGNTGRLTVRINLLRKDCVRGVGVKMLYESYKILDRIEEDEVEPKLVKLLGKENFDMYAGKIWQLKFCEESLHASMFSPQRK